MKVPSSIIILLFAVVFFSCNHEQQSPTLVITGKTSPGWSNTVNLRHGSISLAESWSGQTDSRDSIITLQEDGTFHLKVSLDQARLYSFEHQDQKVEFIASPGDSIHIDLTANTVFSGSNSDQNNHLNAMNAEVDKIENYIVSNQRAFFADTLGRYNANIDSLRSAYLSMNDRFKASNELPQEYQQKILKEIEYRSKFYKIIYPAVHEMYTGDTIQIDQSFYDQITTGSFDDPEFLKLNNYVLFLDRYADIMSAGDLRFRNFYDAGIQKIKPKYWAIQGLDAKQDIKDYLTYEHLRKSIGNYGISYLGDIMTNYKDSSKDSELKEELLKMYDEAQKRRSEPDTIVIYRNVNDIQLEAHIFYPEGHKSTDMRPVYAFFHGGGWATGIPEWGYTNCKRYSKKGMVAVSFEYRLIDIHGSNIIDCVQDANSAIVWLRKEAKNLGIDPDKVISAGFSAGGHIAASTAILDQWTIEDPSGFNSIPNAYITHSASYDTTKSNFFRRQSNGDAESISTHHNVKPNLPPSISFHGTRDHLAPINEFTAYRDKMEQMGNDFEYKIFEGIGHFFADPVARAEVAELTDAFLVKLEYIQE